MPMSGHSHLWYSIFLEGPLVNHLGLLTSAPAGLVYQLTSNIAYVQQERTEASLLGGGGALQSGRSGNFKITKFFEVNTGNVANLSF